VRERFYEPGRLGQRRTGFSDFWHGGALQALTAVSSWRRESARKTPSSPVDASRPTVVKLKGRPRNVGNAA
jgi:hypothetical protein